MWFRLAAQFGCPVGELIDRMSSAEFTYWVEFHAMYPFGPDADLWRSAVVASTVANTGGKRKDGKAWQVKDFLPRNPRKRFKPLPDNLPPEIRQQLLEKRRNG